MKRATIACVTLALFGSIVPTANATFPGRNGRIVMLTSLPTSTQERDGSESFYRSIRPDGRFAQRLSFTGDRARLSPDGEWVAYVEDRDLFRSSVDGSGEERLTTGDSRDQPTWSPDGRQLAFVKYSDNEPSASIFVMDLLSLAESRLTETGFDFHPAWSPDGSRIAFVRCLSYSATPTIWVNRVGQIDEMEGCEDPTELVVLEVSSGGLETITQTSATESTPDWSPDSRKLAYTCDASRKGQEGRGGICVVNLATKRSWVIYRSRRGFDPVWSPNGRRIAFVVYPRTEEDTDSEIYTIRSDGTGLRQITNHAVNDTDPQWMAR